MGNKKSDMNRRQFLHKLGLGAAVMAVNPLGVLAGETNRPQNNGDGNAENMMTYRVQHGSGDKVSLLGFGMMRLPDDQDEVNRLVDYAGRIVLDENDEPVFNFGKHKGRRVVDVLAKEPSYYSWMMDGDFTLDTKQQLTRIKLSMQ